MLNDAIAAGDANRVISFFRGFKREPGRSENNNRPASNRAIRGQQIYTRSQIAQLNEAHRRGAYAGREGEWAQQEYDICRASGEGRIVGGLMCTASDAGA